MKKVEGKVSVTFKDGKTVEKSYERTIFETADDVLSYLTGDRLEPTISALTYGWNLKASAPIRQAIIAESGGPALALANMIKGIMKQRAAVGKPLTEEAASDIAKQILG